MRVGILFTLIVIALLGCRNVSREDLATIDCYSDCGTIHGTITDKDTGDPIVGASVYIVGTNIGTITDLCGQYRITHILSGTYTMRIASVEYMSVEVTQVLVTANGSAEVSCHLNKKVTDIGKIIIVNGDSKTPSSSQPGSLSKEKIMPDAAHGPTTLVETERTGTIQGTITDKESGETNTTRSMTTVDSLLTNVMAVATNTKDEKIIHVTYGNREPIIVNLEPIEWPDKDDSTGMITGTVTDSITDEPIMRVAVSLNGDTTGIFTTFQGEFHFAKLAPGSYQLKLEGVKYTPRIITNIEVRAGEATKLECLLRRHENKIQLFAPHFVDTVDAGKQ